MSIHAISTHDWKIPINSPSYKQIAQIIDWVGIECAYSNSPRSCHRPRENKLGEWRKWIYIARSIDRWISKPNRFLFLHRYPFDRIDSICSVTMITLYILSLCMYCVWWKTIWQAIDSFAPCVLVRATTVLYNNYFTVYSRAMRKCYHVKRTMNERMNNFKT